MEFSSRYHLNFIDSIKWINDSNIYLTDGVVYKKWQITQIDDSVIKISDCITWINETVNKIEMTP